MRALAEAEQQCDLDQRIAKDRDDHEASHPDEHELRAAVVEPPQTEPTIFGRQQHAGDAHRSTAYGIGVDHRDHRREEQRAPD